MHRKIVTLLTVCITMIIIVSLCTSILFFSRNLSKSVTRNFDTPEEERALAAAEKVDYGSIWTLERFHGPSNPEAYTQRGTSLSYTWANFIDIEVIEYYQNRYNHQRKQIIMPRNVAFTYNANVTQLEQLHIFNTTQLEHGKKALPNHPLQFEDITWNITVISFCGPDDSTSLITVRPFGYILYRNQTEYCALSSNFDLRFSDCYLVEMSLNYEENYSRLAGFTSSVRQIVVLDQNLVPIWVGITEFQTIS